MIAMGWTRWKAAYHRDGSLRDIYVRGRTRLGPVSGLGPIHGPCGGLHAIRGQARGAFEPPHIPGDKTFAHNLMIEGDGVEFMCHFFMPTGVDLHFVRRTVASSRSIEPVLGFIDHPGSHLSKDVILTEENSPESIWFKNSCSDGCNQDVSTC